jgi:predicted PurR-regulated permease PerM
MKRLSYAASNSLRSPLYVAAAFTICVWGLYEAQSFLLPICLAALVTFLMTPAMRLLKRLKLPEPLCLIFSALLLLLPLTAILYLVITQIQGLVQDWPHLSASFGKTLANIRGSSIAHRLHISTILNLDTITSRFNKDLGSGVRLALESLAEILSASSLLILVIFFSIVMLASRVHIRRSFMHLFSAYSEISSVSTVDRMATLIETFLVARLGIAGGVGAISLVAMMICGVPYSFILAVIFGLMTWVPVVGFIFGILPILAVAFAIGKGLGIITALFLILSTIWMIQDHILTPKLVGHKLQLNFMATYLVFFAGERLWGPWGMFLSVPMLGVLRIVLSESARLKPWAFLLGEEKRPSSLMQERNSERAA